jgi:5-hydroxyisourate hydrolase
MISTHILDTTLGVAAQGIAVTLFKKNNNSWEKVSEGETNADGRFVFSETKGEGHYQIEFDIESYYQNTTHFFLNPLISFKIVDTNRKYHVPIIINPYGFSTYRGT